MKCRVWFHGLILVHAMPIICSCYGWVGIAWYGYSVYKFMWFNVLRFYISKQYKVPIATTLPSPSAKHCNRNHTIIIKLRTCVAIHFKNHD